MNTPETNPQTKSTPSHVGMRFVLKDSKEILNEPQGWKFETRSTFFKIAISPEGRAYWIQEQVGSYVLLEYKIATPEDAQRTRGALRVGKAFVGEKFAEWKKS
jgi:hypothetical protein